MTNNEDLEVGKRIKALRTNKGLTQSDLADILGVTRSVVNRYESGVIRNLKTDKVKLLADTFNVTPSYILGLSDKMYTARERSPRYEELIKKCKILSDSQVELVLALVDEILK